MNTVSFRNKGLIDLRAVRTFGMSAKECENPIGFFGTGLKYAIAICLRLGGKITLWRGTDRIDFALSEAELRGVSFKVVTMVFDAEAEFGEPEHFELGFTTDLGKKWTPWQAFRELYCNTIDEGGECAEGVLVPLPDRTTIVVAGEEFYKAYEHRAEIILQTIPQWTTGNVQIHARRTEYAYYRGIRVGELQHEAALTYDVRSPLNLTEDRTIDNMYYYNNRVRDALLTTDNEELLRRFFAAPADSFEAKLDLDCWTDPSETFLSVLENLAFRDCHSVSARLVYKKHRKILLEPDATPLNRVEELQLRRAIRFCEHHNWPVQDYEIIVTADLPEEIWGRAYEGKIYVNRSAFASGTKIVAGTLIEEFLHLRDGFEDESRRFQNYLINALVSMGEQVMGEPL